MRFDDLVGQEFLFYGVDNYTFKLDETVWEATEDPGDGYRSYLASIEVNKDKGIFFREPLAIVKVENDNDTPLYHDAADEGYRLTDDDNHIWLRFGTSYSDSYYPSFYFQYSPKPIPKKTKTPPKKEEGHNDDPFDRLFNPREA